MGHVTGFLDRQRAGMTYLPAAERLRNWDEFAVPQPEEVLKAQGSRCMDCGIPYCHAIGCPLGNLIPEWNDLVYRGEWMEAYTRLEMTEEARGVLHFVHDQGGRMARQKRAWLLFGLFRYQSDSHGCRGRLFYVPFGQHRDRGTP